MIRPTNRLTVTMEAQAWEAAMRWLAKAPYEAVAGLIGIFSGNARINQVSNRLIPLVR